MIMPDTSSTAVSRALAGLCPHCGEGKLFKSWLQFLPHCPVCDLDYQSFDIGDGGAVLSIWIIGALTTTLAAIVEVAYQPPYWLHAVLWIPFVIFGSLLSLHWCRAWMLGASYKHDRLG